MPDTNETRTENSVTRDLTMAATAPGDAGDGDYVVLPDGCHVEDLEGYQDTPRRTKRNLELYTLDSLLEYLDEFATPATKVFADKDNLRLIVVVDYPTPDSPAWEDHKVLFALPRTDVWTEWNMENKRWMGQQDFAHFVEERLDDFHDPGGAAMLELARNLKAERNVEFQSKVNEHNGDLLFRFQKETEVVGEVKAPETFTVKLKPFQGADLYKVNARLMYDIDGGALRFRYKLKRESKVIEKCFEDVVESIETHGDGYQVLMGDPTARPNI